MYVKKVKKSYFYKMIIIITSIMTLFEVLDWYFIGKEFDIGKVIAYLLGCATAAYFEYSKLSPNANDKGEIVLEDEFSKQISLQYNTYFFGFLVIVSVILLKCVEWSGKKSVSLDIIGLFSLIMFLLYCIAYLIYKNKKS